MIESTKKKEEKSNDWINTKKTAKSTKKKKKTILPLQQSFFFLTAHLICIFFSVEFFGHNCKQLFFLSIVVTLPFVLRQVWFASPIVCVKKKQLTESLQAKLSENSTKKKENNTAALNWVSVEKKKDAYKLVDLLAQLIGVFFF